MAGKGLAQDANDPSNESFLWGWGAVLVIAVGLVVGWVLGKVAAWILSGLDLLLESSGVPMPVRLLVYVATGTIPWICLMVAVTAYETDRNRSALDRLRRGDGNWHDVSWLSAFAVVTVALLTATAQPPDRLAPAYYSIRDAAGLWPLLVMGLAFAGAYALGKQLRHRQSVPAPPS